MFVPNIRWYSAALVCVLGCQDNALTKFNNDPTTSIRSPADGSLVARGEPFNATGSADDDDHATMDLVASWYVDGELICEENLDEDGETRCELTVDTADATITLEVTDPMGASGQSQVEVGSIDNNLPTITVESPLPSRTYYRDQKVPFLGTVADAEDDPGDLLVEIESDLDGAWDITVHSDGTLSGSQFLSEAEHTISVSATDTLGGTVTENVTIVVGGPNTPPTCYWCIQQ